MAAGDPYIGCTNPTISDEELLNSLLVVTAAGVTGIRIVPISAAAADISLAVNCEGPLKSLSQILRESIGLTASGEPGLVLIQES